MLVRHVSVFYSFGSIEGTAELAEDKAQLEELKADTCRLCTRPQ